MKWKLMFIALIVVLSSSLFMGCSNGQDHASKAANRTEQKSGKSDSHKKSNTDPQFFTFLGISQKDYKKEKKAGKSIVEIAEEKNKTEQEVIDFLVKDREQTFKKNNPNITEDKLNEKKQQWTKKIKAEVEKKKKQMKGE